MTCGEYARKFKKALQNAGYQVIKAKYDKGNNCLICGESGRCAGWHIDTNKQNQFVGIAGNLENTIKDKLNATMTFYV